MGAGGQQQPLDPALAALAGVGQRADAVGIGQVDVGAGVDQQAHDLSAHAELQAIRQASQALGSPRLDGCVIYASGHPCPMCLAAMHLCGIQAAWFAYSNEDGEAFGLSTATLYAEMARPPQRQSLPLRALRPAGEEGLYRQWRQRQA